MMPLLVDYASPSAYQSDRERAMLALTANAHRPVRFHGRVVREGFALRIALRTLGELIWSNDTWVSEAFLLDPVITVHPDRIFFEAFSLDQSAYGALIVDPAIFETEGEIVTGTTNVDFSAWLWGALGEMRTGRDTTFRIGTEGFEVRTAGAGGRFEGKVDLPDSWVRGFLQLQSAMAMPGTRLSVRPVDLLAAIRFLRYTKAKISPRALRYEFEPGEPAKLVLEPWEHEVTLKGAGHSYEERRVIRTWGRRRLRWIEGLLPFADTVDIYLKGRALPSFYAIKLPGMTFVLGLSGWSAAGWTGSGSFDLLGAAAKADDVLVARALDLLRERYHVSSDEVAGKLGVDRPAATGVLVRLCRQGRAIYDVEARRYRHRELFEEPPDEAKLFPPDARSEAARRHIETGAVRVEACEVEETSKVRRLRTVEGKVTREVIYRDWRVRGSVGGVSPVEIVIGDTGRIIFGKCSCPFFVDNIMNRGPCEHMIALFEASEALRRDLPASREASEEILRRPTRPSSEELEAEDADDTEEDTEATNGND